MCTGLFAFGVVVCGCWVRLRPCRIQPMAEVMSKTCSKQQWGRGLALVVAALVLMPMLVLFSSWSEIQTDIWSHLWQTQLPTLLGNTLMLLAGVTFGVLLLGVSLAWLTAVCEFPGRRWLDWALMLPFAVPAYVLAFVFVGLLDFSGPVQSFLRQQISGFTYVNVRGTVGVVTVLVLVFYPYVYMLARGAFLAQGRGLMDAARILGVSPLQGFVRVALPMARPAIAAGVALALMETLADFGAVSVFNYDTFTTAIYKSWYGFFNLQSAAQLATLLLLLVALALTCERRVRGKARFEEHERRTGQNRYRLTGLRAWLASGYCMLVVLVAFGIPVLQLLVWNLKTGWVDLDARYLDLIAHTLFLGAMAALLTVLLALLLAVARRLHQDRWTRVAVSISTLGYALPGSVLAVGMMIAFTQADHLLAPLYRSFGWGSQVLMGSVFVLVLAYCIRFMAVAFGPIDSGLARIRPALGEAARLLGCRPWGVAQRVYLPMLMPGLFSALVLVFVDVLKEMPATLLMRPFGWDTLAVRIYEMTSEGEWERAALPALTLVLVGLLPVIMLMRRSAQKPGSSE